MVGSKKELVYYFILNFISKGFTYVLLLVFANLFTQEQYGEASYIYAIFSIILIFSFIGLPDIFIAWLIKDKDIASVFYFLLIWVGLFVIGSSLFFWKEKWAFVLILSLPFLLFQKLGLTHFSIKHKYHLVQIFGTLSIIITLILVILLKDFGKSGIIGGYAFSYIITSLIVIWFTRKFLFKIMKNIKFNYLVIIDYFKKSISGTTLGLFFAFLGWVDLIILGLLSTFQNVAKYNIISSLAFIITIIPITLYQFVLVRSAEVHNEEVRISILKRVLRISFSFSIVLAVALVAFMPLILKIFFPKYLGLEIYIMILLIGMLFYSIYQLITVYLIGILQPEKILMSIFIAAAFNIVLDIILVINFGLYGIIIATTIAHLIAFSLLIMKAGLFKQFSPIYLFSIFMVLSYFMGYYGLILIPFLIALLFYFNLIEIQDLKIVTDTFKTVFKK